MSEPKDKTIDELIDASSLGTPEAKAIRAKADPKQVARVLDLLKEFDAHYEPDLNEEEDPP